MRTSKLFSTISYNSNEFLEKKIDEFIAAGILDFACYIEHQPEEDEKKCHKHVLFFPSTIIDTNIFLKEFAEVDSCNSKPLGCTIAVSSKFDDWYLYAVHDKAYLAKKGQSRKYHYTFSQVRNTNEEHFRELVNSIDRSAFIGTERVINAVKAGMDFSELVVNGAVPVQLINQYLMAYSLIKQNLTKRNGRKTHTPNLEEVDLVCNENGEIIEDPFE